MLFIKLFIKITKKHSRLSTAETAYERTVIMKKYFALIISIIVILTCFTACKPKIKDGTLVTNAAGENFAAVTQADGNVVIDEGGNIVVLVTDEDGKNVKGDDGEYATNKVALDHALVIGNRVECEKYAITIPNGWSDASSFNGLSIKRDGTEDVIVINERETDIDTAMADTMSAIDLAKAAYDNTTYENKQIMIGDMEAQFVSLFIPDNGTVDINGNPGFSYMGYIFFEHAGTVYTVRISSTTSNMSEDLDEITAILDTIEFRTAE